MAVIDDLIQKHKEGTLDAIDKMRLTSYLLNANNKYKETCEKVCALLDEMADNYKTEMQMLDLSFYFVARSMGNTNVVALMGTEKDALLAMGAMTETLYKDKEKEKENGKVQDVSVSA